MSRGLALGKKRGVKSAKVSLNERMANVGYDSAKAIMTVSDIAKTVNDSWIYCNSAEVKQIGFFEVIEASSYFFLVPHFG